MGCGTLFATVNQDELGLCEVFANLGKAGGCPSQSEATCRVISIALRSGVDPRVLIEQLRGIRCLSTAMARKTTSDIDVLSCPDAIARAIEEALGEEVSLIESSTGKKCPDCGRGLRLEAGCVVCDSCGYSKCG
jgi:ribonucleoside-diphosphate reductase alpha chain